ncbi:Cyclic nucleotide-gated potassium channel [Halioglobus japonicus]|nr:Cyclic nucleotide-gated potassium channel [Halioglobus japonicus]
MGSARSLSLLDTPVFSGIIATLILFSTICFSLETIPDLDPLTQKFLYYSEIVIVGIFSVEYLYRIYVAESRLRFIFSFYGLVDLLAILPFYIAPMVDLRTLRLLRFFRLARLIKLARYHKAIARFGKAFTIAKEELVIFIVATLIFVYLAAVGIYYFEHATQPDVYITIFDSLWWAVTSLTTVGYGDMYPITAGGRIFSFFILMLGLGLVAVPAGVMASALSAIRRQEERELSEIERTK